MRGLTAKAAEVADPLAAAVHAILDARLDERAIVPVVVALSGGGDSLALLHLAAVWARERGRPLLALTVDHGLNPASVDWTRAACAMACEAAVDWRGPTWEGEKPSTGLAAAARIARHRLLADAAREAGARVLLLAHTADDVAEGERMRAADAPGLGRLREWGPSPAWPEGRGVALLRPLLGVRRTELRAWLVARGLRWIDDPANADASHPRIRARRELRGDPLSPLPPEPVTAAPLFDADGAGAVRASRTALTRPPSAAVLPQLAAALACAGGTTGPVRGRVAADLLGDLRSGAPVRAVAAGALVVARGDAVTLVREPDRPSRPAADPAEAKWVAPRLALSIGRIRTEAELAAYP